MRKLFRCALMMTLFLLPGCALVEKGINPEQIALNIRSDYLAARNISSQVSLTADYGHRVYEYEMDLQVQGDLITLTLTAPDYASGITAQIQNQQGILSYQDISVETGPLNPEGLTPMSSVPALLDAVRSGYITSCILEDSGLLRIDCGQPDVPPGTGTEMVLWFQPETSALTQGDILVDGFRHITCRFSQFTKE